MLSYSGGGLKPVPQKNTIYKTKKSCGHTLLFAENEPFDYYKRAELVFEPVGNLPQRQLYIEITYLDDFISYMRSTGKGMAGYTALKTNRVRSAVFALDTDLFEAAGGTVAISGCSSLIDIVVTDDFGCAARAVAARITKNELVPLVDLKKDMQLAATCGTEYLLDDKSHLQEALDTLDEVCPLMRRMGFNIYEGYVTWNMIETSPGVFDFSFYDALVQKAAEYDMKWFVLLVVGSAHALPEWFHDGIGATGFKCLEHGISNEIPTIFNRSMDKYVKTFLHEFGRHYEPTGRLAGVRLGPSGNYGESQYPASGQNGYKHRPHHIHLGWWAADDCASPAFRAWLEKKYDSVSKLSSAWGKQYGSFNEVETFLPATAVSNRMRKDFVDWYNFEMTDWCEKWAVWARESMPDTRIFQSIGGWGFEEAGTDFTAQPRSMGKIGGKTGARSTNEDDDYLLNNNITRLISSAAHYYGVPYGSEPAGRGSSRGLSARIYNILARCGIHMFFFLRNLTMWDGTEDMWLRLAPLLDMRDEPLCEIAMYYPETKSRLDDSVVRYLQASGFFSRTSSLRKHFDFDFCSDTMIRDGALDTYKVLVFPSRWHESSDVIEKDALDKIETWVRGGGIAIYPARPRMKRLLETVEGDDTVYRRFSQGETGNGRVLIFEDDFEPTERFSSYVSKTVRNFDFLRPQTKRMLNLKKPDTVFAACYEDGRLLLLNFDDEAVCINDGANEIALDPYEIKII